MMLALFLSACGGGGTQTSVTPPPTQPGNAPTPSSNPTAPSSFGMQCGVTKPGPGQVNCYGSASTPIVWPTTQAQPGMLRLHDAGTYWSTLNPASGALTWTNLDNWLDLINTRESISSISPVSVMQVFTWVPCWDSSSGTCEIDPTAPSGTNGVPNDLTSAGSNSFNAFVTAFVQHCSPAGNCVKDLIKYYEMWNEWDLEFHWTGTITQVYQMVAPAAQIIKANVPNAVILTPSSTPDAVGSASNTGLTYEQDFQNWLNLETANGRISDWIAWHVYLSSNTTTTNTPEQQFSNYALNFLNIQSATAGWTTTPWANTETNFDSGTNYTCPSDQYTADDCTGQIVRWQLLHASTGGSSLDWYKWDQTIGTNQQYETAYYEMMQYMVGGTFTAVCSPDGSGIWTCPFTEASGTSALWIWTQSEAGVSYTATGYSDYRDLNGNTTAVTTGQSITIGTEPFLLEQ
jgi:hypothetical protein